MRGALYVAFLLWIGVKSLARLLYHVQRDARMRERERQRVKEIRYSSDDDLH